MRLGKNDQSATVACKQIRIAVNCQWTGFDSCFVYRARRETDSRAMLVWADSGYLGNDRAADFRKFCSVSWHKFIGRMQRNIHHGRVETDSIIFMQFQREILKRRKNLTQIQIFSARWHHWCALSDPSLQSIRAFFGFWRTLRTMSTQGNFSWAENGGFPERYHINWTFKLKKGFNSLSLVRFCGLSYLRWFIILFIILLSKM